MRRAPRRGADTLKKSAEFKRVFEKGFCIFRNGLQFYILAVERPGLRVGIITPKRYGHAVARNKFRRRLREAIRTSAELPHGFDIVICLTKPCESFSFEMIRQTLEWVWGRLHRSSSSHSIAVVGV